VKVSAPRMIVIQEDGQERPTRYFDAAKAAEHWARVKADEWVEKHKKDPIYQRPVTNRYHRQTTTNLVHDEGRVRYRKLKRRALRVFRKILGNK
jgi:hypothetical protein